MIKLNCLACSIKDRRFFLDSAFLFLIVFSFLFSRSVYADLKRLDLAQCIERAIEVSHSRKAALAKVMAADAQLKEAQAIRLPQIQFKTLLGPAPGAELDRTNFPEEPLNILETTTGSRDFFSDLSVFTRTEIDLVLPLYTFGKISSAIAAAQAGKNALQAQVKSVESEIRLQVKELYYALLLSEELLKVTTEVEEKLSKAEKRLEELLSQGSENVDQSDSAKLKVFHATLGEQINAVKKGKQIAYEALQDVLNFTSQEPFWLADDALKPLGVQLKPLEIYLAKTTQSRPEIEALTYARSASQEGVHLTKADFFPEIFLASGLRAAYAPNVEDLDNPFISQYFRTLSFGVAIGVRLSFDLFFQGQRAKHDRAQAKHTEVSSQADLAHLGILLEVKKSYFEAEEALSNIELSKERFKAARSWVVSETFNYDIGVGKVKDLLESLGAFADAKAKLYQRIQSYNVAIAKLSKAVGSDIESD